MHHGKIAYTSFHITWKWRNCPVQSQPLLLILHFTRSDSIFLSQATSGKNCKRRNTKEQLLQCVSFRIACTSIDFVFKSLKSALHVFHCSIGYFWYSISCKLWNIIELKVNWQIWISAKAVNYLRDGPCCCLRVLQRLEEKKKTEERREPTVDVHSSGRQVGTPQLKFYSTATSLAGSKHSPILKQSDFTWPVKQRITTSAK